MEIRHRILEFSNNPRYEALKAELDRLGARYQITMLGSVGGVESRSIEFTISERDPLYPQIAKLIEKYGFYVQTGVHYSQQDIDEAEWLVAITGEYQYPQPEEAYIETTYDITAYCPFCGMGAVQNHAFRLKSDFKQKRSQFLGLFWVHDEIFVRPTIKRALEEARIEGIGFLPPVYHRTGDPIESVFQLVIHTVSAPGLITEGLQPVTCQEANEEGFPQRKSGGAHGIGRCLEEYSFCGRVKYYHPRTTMITYARSSLTGMPDVAKSSEYFGSGAAADRLILVHRRFVDLVKRNSLRGIRLMPLRLV